MRRMLRSTAKEISRSLSHEVHGYEIPERTGSGDLLDDLGGHLGDKIASQIGAGRSAPASERSIDRRLRRLETALGLLAGSSDADVNDSDDSALPNLKYAKPKYKDVESVLRYVESDDQKGGLKLVIMNFND